MTVIGSTRHVTILPDERDNNYRFKDHLFRKCLGENTQSQLKDLAGAYYRVIGTKSSVEQSIKKMDFPKITGYKHSVAWNMAKDFVYDMWHLTFSDNTRYMSLDEMLPGLNLNSSPGAPWVQLGFKTKRQLLNFPEFYDYYSSDPFKRKPPIWKVSPKTEIYSLEDLENNKVRTFIIPPLDFLLLQKHYFETQNRSMKEKHWSAYGFNPYQGGVARYAERLLIHKIFIFYDVKGWDRKLPLMEAVYKLRISFISDDDHARFAWWVADHIVSSILLHTDGTLFKKYIGNNSGSGCTTNDNILAHCFILAYVLIILFKGDLQIVLAVIALLFGDDNAMSIPDPGVSDSDIESIFRSCYLDFGLELDPFYVQHELEGVEFLGFKFHFFESVWIPQYNIGRLMAAYVYTIEKKQSDSISLSRAWMLTLMCAGNGREIYSLVASATQRYMDFLKDSTDTEVLAFRRIGVPSFEETMSFYLGRETSFDFSLFDYSILEEVG